MTHTGGEWDKQETLLVDSESESAVNKLCWGLCLVFGETFSHDSHELPRG